MKTYMVSIMHFYEAEDDEHAMEQFVDGITSGQETVTKEVLLAEITGIDEMHNLEGS